MTIVIILSFISVFLLVSATYLIIVEARESNSAVLKRRLRRMARTGGKEYMPEDLRSEIIREIPPLERFLARVPMIRNMDKLLDRAGVRTTLTNFLSFIFLAMTAGYVAVFFLTRNAVWAFTWLAASLILPFAYLQYRKVKRLNTFTEQLPDVLNMISRSLRAGHSLASAIELVGQEMPDPAKELFRTAFEQQKLGLRITDTLSNMVDRIESMDLRFFATAVTINTEVGGNLGEILDKLAETIRERLKIRRQVQVYTAQGRMSGYILCAMPIASFFMFNIIMPGYEDVLVKAKTGQIVLAAAIAAQFAGFLVIRKIIKIRI